MTILTEEPAAGTALQEMNFWSSLETALAKIQVGNSTSKSFSKDRDRRGHCQQLVQCVSNCLQTLRTEKKYNF